MIRYPIIIIKCSLIISKFINLKLENLAVFYKLEEHIY